MAFLMIVIDRDKRVFNVLGPMTDDRVIGQAVCDAQDAGRQVNCHTIKDKSRESLIESYGRDSGFKFTEEPIVNG